MKKQAHYAPDTPITASAQAAGFLREDLRSLDHEESWILLLNAAKLPLAKKMITVGTLKSTPIDHRRVIKEALLTNASAIILFHNHPSGSAVPSASDINENNLPGIGAWLKKNGIASPLGYKQRSGFCQYELYSFLRA